MKKKKGEIPKWCWVYGFRVVTDARPDVKHRPIMFKAPMVRAILEGRKAQTRRPVKQQPKTSAPGLYADRYNHSARWAYWLPDGRMDSPRTFASPQGEVGERLWVKETWAAPHDLDALKPSEMPESARIHYLASEPGPSSLLWRPSMFMQQRFSRLTLEIVSVQVERVEAISGEDAVAEGIRPFIGGPWGTYYAVAAEDEPHATAQAAFLWLWRSMYGS